MVSPIAMIGMGCVILAFAASLILLRRLGAHEVATSLAVMAAVGLLGAFAGVFLS